jgi:hypothetical protein
MRILSQRITDKKFLRLIQRGLECGIVLDFIRYDTILGTPQGTICSPILFNIYMQEFDKFIKEKLLNLIQDPNTDTTAKKHKVNSEYSKYRSRSRKVLMKLQEFQTKYNNSLKEVTIRRFMEFISDSTLANQIIQNNPKIKEAYKHMQTIFQSKRDPNKNESYKFAHSPKKSEAFRQMLFENISEHTKS